MMRNNRVKPEESSSSDEEDSSDSEKSDSEDDKPVIQVGFLKVHYQKKDLIKETIARFS